MASAKITLLGGMGVGKTTLAKAMEVYYGFKAILEDPSTVKTALSRLPENAPEKPLVNELLFLDQRDKLLKQAFSSPGNVVVDMDLLIEKIWGDLMLDHPVHREAFEKIYDFYEAHLPKPDLTIYLRCEPAENLKRIQKRARSFEAGIDIEFLENLEACTERHVKEQLLSQKILTIDVTSINPENNPTHLHYIVSEIFTALKSPARSRAPDFHP